MSYIETNNNNPSLNNNSSSSTIRLNDKYFMQGHLLEAVIQE